MYMKVQVRLNNYRRSAKKVRELIPVIKGLDVDQAENQLRALTKGSAPDMLKLLLSAVATAKNDFNLREEDLFVENVMIQEGKTMKRWRARAYGRANQILKRSCHILLTVAERKDSIERESIAKKQVTSKAKNEKGKKSKKKVEEMKNDDVKNAVKKSEK